MARAFPLCRLRARARARKEHFRRLMAGVIPGMFCGGVIISTIPGLLFTFVPPNVRPQRRGGSSPSPGTAKTAQNSTA